MSSPSKKSSPFSERMKAEGLPEIAIKTFEFYHTQLREGHTGLIHESDILPVESLPDAATFPAGLAEKGEAVLPRTVLLKLNGGLGTSMGMNRAKSLLTVKNGLSFLDVIARQALRLHIPLVLMNSFNTREDSLEALKKYPELWGAIPLDFLQHKVPKINREDLSPATYPRDPNLEWCPPGHGDIYTALVTSGMLDTLLAAGYDYAFVSNSDNLGAVIDTRLLGYFADQGLPFMMEACERTESDKKGGHLARLPDGQLILRESAQCPPEEMDAFQDIGIYHYFNTNNLWFHLPSLKSIMAVRDNIPGLPMIRNSKTVNPRDKNSQPVYQLETAMGSAIAIFEGAGAVHVTHARFVPVKRTSDLLAVRSDAFTLTDDFRIVPNPARKLKPIVITLDPHHYALIDDMESRFPHGPPSLIACAQLNIRGDITFGRNVTLKGVVRLTNESGRQVEIEDGAVIEGEWRA